MKNKKTFIIAVCTVAVMLATIVGLTLYSSSNRKNNIQKVVADYYSLPLRTMLSDSKKRTIARARQMAMALSRELTGRSLPELGEAYGRDHSTVLNACKVITKLRESDATVSEDWNKLMRKLAE